METASNQVVECMSRGLSHTALCQLDKHSDEQALKRVNSNVINACIEVASLVKTDVRELRGPWFSSGHEKIGSVIFVTVSLEGVVFFTDDTKCALVCYRQNPLPRKLSWLSYGELEGDKNPVPQASNSVVLTGSLWKGITGNDFTSAGDNLLITDPVFKTVRVVKNANKLWRDPKKVLMS